MPKERLVTMTGGLNQHCSWPERWGLRAHVVDTKGAEHIYPVHGMSRNEVIVFIPDDPLGRGDLLVNGQRWSCVTSRRSIDFDA